MSYHLSSVNKPVFLALTKVAWVPANNPLPELMEATLMETQRPERRKTWERGRTGGEEGDSERGQCERGVEG